MWRALEQYKEFITNGLDLVSFLLATPELLRKIKPALEGMPAVLYMSGLVVGLAYLTYKTPPSALYSAEATLHPDVPQDWESRYGHFAAWVDYVTSLGTVALVLAPPVALFVRFGASLTKHGLAVGVGLFCLSRLIAFGFAWYDMGAK